MIVSAFVLVCCVLCTATDGLDQYLNPEWIEPHAWGNEKDPLQQLCPQASVATCDKQCDKRNLEIAFKKFVHIIFGRDKFKRDDSSKYFYRSVHIHATEEQLTKLDKLSDPNDIDGMLAEILAQSNFGTKQLVKEHTLNVPAVSVWSKFSFGYDIPPRTRQITINFALLVFAYIVCRRCGINFLVVIVFGLGYFLYEYLDYECHKRIAVEDTISFIYGDEKNPCTDSSNRGWFSFLLGKSSRAECREYLSKRNRDGKQCGMVDLFHEFTSNILYTQMSMFFMGLANLIQALSTTYGIIITVITLFVMRDILKVMIYSVFKYILNPASWSGFMAATATAQNSTTQDSSPRHPIESAVDIKDINLGKALDLANSQIQIILTENAISTAIKAYLPAPNVHEAPSIEGKSTLKRQHSQSEASDTSSSSNSFRMASQMPLESSGIQLLRDTIEITTSTPSTTSTTESESYEEITYDELIIAATAAMAADHVIEHIDVVTLSENQPLSMEGQLSLSDELANLDNDKSSKSSSCSTLPSDIELLNADTDDSFSKNPDS